MEGSLWMWSDGRRGWRTKETIGRDGDGGRSNAKLGESIRSNVGAMKESKGGQTQNCNRPAGDGLCRKSTV